MRIRGEGEEMKRAILIVDDEKRVLFVLRNALMKLEDGFEVLTAATAGEGLRKVEEVTFDLIITDLIMPGMDGIEFTERIREMDDSPAVVWMTAYGCPSFQDDADRLRVYRCIEKPLEIGEFRRVARQALTEGGQGGDGGSEFDIAS